MDPRVRQVLGGKRLALMRRIAHELSWPDTALFDDIAVGFRLTGYLDRTGVFASDVKPATMDLDEFWASASLRRDTLLEKVSSQKDQEYAEALWQMTLEKSRIGRAGDGLTAQPMSARFLPFFRAGGTLAGASQFGRGSGEQ